MLITTYLCTDSGYKLSGLIHDEYNDDGEFGAGRKLVKMMQTLQVYNMTFVILRFYAKHRGL